MAKETEMNLAQSLAKMFLLTNPSLIHDHTKLDAVSFLVSTLTDPETVPH